jgi:uncharacterized protein YjbI with pentapeptide repeats
MLQHNLGLAYYHRIQGDRRENLERSIECFNNSLQIYTQQNFPEKWEINQQDLGEAIRSLEIDKKTLLIREIINSPRSNRDLHGANLSDADLSYEIVTNASFSNNQDISTDLRSDLEMRGAIFEDKSDSWLKANPIDRV